jgi:uncharacterized protein YbjT (DUF2867 family)
MQITIAGATGAVGFEAVRLAKADAHRVCAISFSGERARKLTGIADSITTLDATVAEPDLTGSEIVISALGAAVTVGASERRRYRDVDFVANMNILRAAKKAGVRRFIYVSVHVEPSYADTAYIRAHEDFVAELRRSGLSYCVIRPTGIFPAFNDFIDLARKGLATTIGDGKARTNPVHPTDVAQLIMQHLNDSPAEAAIGGPDILTRRQVAELAFHVLGKRPRIMRVPPGVFRVGAKLAAPFNPRLGDMFEFVTAVTTTDCIAPALGTRRLEDHFRTLAAVAPKTSAAAR